MDLIPMDIQMPDMDGIRACELIHHLSHHQQTPVIAVTAHALEGQREKLLSAGMNDYLAKPIEEEKLHALLLRYQPGLHSASFRRRYRPQSRSPIIIKRSTGSYAAPGGHEAGPGAGDAANADRLYAGGA